MSLDRLARLLADRRGVALPMALMAMLIIGALVVAFSLLSASEPLIAANHLRTAQARALAEAGIERVLWALSTGQTSPSTPGVLLNPLPVPVPPPYDGSALVAVSTGGSQIGGFRVTVSPGAAPNERAVAAVGWVPTDAPSDTRTKAHQRITATVMNFNFRPLDAPCALCVRGDIQIGGSSSIDSRPDTSCGSRVGTYSTRVRDEAGNVISPGQTVIGSGAAKVWGADGNSTPNQPTDMLQAQDQAVFDQYTFTHADLNTLKAYAKSRGTYYQGAVTFNASNKIPNGIIFVDTASGNNITPATPTSDYASLSIHGNAPADLQGIFRGWIVVNGSVAISGNFEMYGMVYAVNDISYTGTGNGQIVGQMISQNVRDTIATVIDTSLGGNSSITYNCSHAKTGGGQVPQGWIVRAGTYREVADP